MRTPTTATCGHCRRPIDRTAALCADCVTAYANMSPLTRPQVRAFLRAIGRPGLPLETSLDRPMYVRAIDDRIWEVQALITGAYTIKPYEPTP